MSEGYWKWRGQLSQRKKDAKKYDQQIINCMAKHGWEHVGAATEDEDMKQKWDHAYIKHAGTEEEVFALVDHKLGGVRDDHIKWINKHGKSHGVTHYCFATINKHTNKVTNLRLMTVEHFMSNKKRLVNRSSGEVFWLPR